jgi:hypothetical protein
MSISPIGPGLDDVAGDVDAAVAAAAARSRELGAQTHAQGSTIGAELDLPLVNSDFSKRTGGVDAREHWRPRTA